MLSCHSSFCPKPRVAYFTHSTLCRMHKFETDGFWKMSRVPQKFLLARHCKHSGYVQVQYSSMEVLWPKAWFEICRVWMASRQPVCCGRKIMFHIQCQLSRWLQLHQKGRLISALLQAWMITLANPSQKQFYKEHWTDGLDEKLVAWQQVQIYCYD